MKQGVISIEYSLFKEKLLKRTLLVGILASGIIAIFSLEDAFLLIKGALIGLAYIFSLFMYVETPHKTLAVMLSIVRMLIVSFLIVWIGHFRLWDISIVFCGFLSYKGVLIFEMVRSVLGIPHSRVK